MVSTQIPGGKYVLGKTSRGKYQTNWEWNETRIVGHTHQYWSTLDNKIPRIVIFLNCYS